jgi:sulfur-carrier protein adenylyltransferase/sulfurtransferase
VVADDSVLVGVGQGPEAGERARGVVLVEAPERGCDLRRKAAGIGGERIFEGFARGHRPPDALECDSVGELRVAVAGRGPPLELGELALGGQALEPGRRLQRSDEGRPPGRELRMEDVLGTERRRRVRIGSHRLSPLPDGPVVVPRSVEREAEVKPGDAARRVVGNDLLEALDRPVGPTCDRRPDGGLHRARVLSEELCEARARLLPLPVLEKRLGLAERTGFGVVADEETELERRRPALGPGRGWLRALSLLSLENRNADDERSRSGCGKADEDAGTRAGHVCECSPALAKRRMAVAILPEAMPSYREFLQQVKSEIEEIGVSGAAELRESDEAVFVDVREQNEWDEGHVPGALHVPRGNLESRIEQAVPDRDASIVVYCASGSRSAFAAKALEELGYEDVVSLAGGFTDWKRNGFPFDVPRALGDAGRRRYSRHLLIPEVGEEGQLRLLDSRILLIGAGGLGSPASLYLAAAGVGTLGIVDDDAVDETNLQRQIVHSTERLGESKAESAKRTIEALNPDVTVKVFKERLTSDNVDRILGDGWDVIVDGADNFPTRYLLNDASVWHDIPVVHGSIFRFEGQTTVFKPKEGPCYRCLFPQPPPPELAPSCAEGGVLGVLPGIVGSLQANEALKLALGVGEPLIGRLLLFDALSTQFTEITLRRDPDCPVCGESPTITDYVDYVEFCQGPAHQVAT